MLPEGWEDRLVRVESQATRGAVGLCLEIHDLVISKYVAEREKDLDFNRAAISHGLVDRKILLARLPSTPISAEGRDRIRAFILRDCSG